MKHKILISLALVLALSASLLTFSASAATSGTGSSPETAAEETQEGRRGGRHGGGMRRKQETAEPENAVGKDAARETALADAGVTAEQAGRVRARVSQLEDGTVVYRIRFTCDGQRYSYRIDATAGTVISRKTEDVSDDAAAGSPGHGERAEGKRVGTAGSAAEARTPAV